MPRTAAAASALDSETIVLRDGAGAVLMFDVGEGEGKGAIESFLRAFAAAPEGSEESGHAPASSVGDRRAGAAAAEAAAAGAATFIPPSAADQERSQLPFV